MKFQENVSLAKLSNYKIGGPAMFFFEAGSAEELAWAVREAKKRRLKIFVLGAGTNLLISDRGWRGLVLKPNINFLERNGSEVKVGAGTLMSQLLDFAAKNELSGLEWAGGLPGTLGGAIRGNAGCFGGEIKDSIKSVQSLDTKALAVIERSANKCGFGYRDSIFKRKDGAEIILSAILHLRKGDKGKITKRIKEKIAYRRKIHPLEYPNVGSIFKNVPLSSIHKGESREHREALKNLKLQFCGAQFSVKNDPFPVISAAKLISAAGLRGVSFGGAMISPKHPNFIVNVLDAKASDVKNLINLIKKEVHGKFSIKLEEEIMEI